MEGKLETVGFEDNLEAIVIDQFFIMGGIPGKPDIDRDIESLGQQSALVVDAGIVGTTDGFQTFFPQDCGGFLKEEPGGLGIVLAFKEAEEAGPIVVVRVVRAIDDGGDAPHGPSVAVGDKGMNLSMTFMKGGFWREILGDAARKRGNEGGMGAIQVFSDLFELLFLPGRLTSGNGNHGSAKEGS